jgi:hypothetical protein
MAKTVPVCFSLIPLLFMRQVKPDVVPNSLNRDRLPFCRKLGQTTIKRFGCLAGDPLNGTAGITRGELVAGALCSLLLMDQQMEEIPGSIGSLYRSNSVLTGDSDFVKMVGDK